MRRRPIENSPETLAASGLLLDIRPDGVYFPAHITVALQLRKSSLYTAWKRGQLKMVRRGKRNYLLGRDILEWLAGGQILPKAKRQPAQATA